MKKLTRKASILLMSLSLIVLLGIGVYCIKDQLFEKKSSEETDQYSIALVAENQEIVSTYLDTISTSKSSDTYTECKVCLEKGTKVKDYEISQNQTFSKYIQLKGPNGTDLLTKSSKQVITHYAYSLLLIGDIQEKTNLRTNEKTYEVVNARVTYDRIPLVLLSNENNVCLRNTKQTKEKFVNLQDFIDALKDTEKRDEMISW